MKIIETLLPGVVVIEPRIFGDDRPTSRGIYGKSKLMGERTVEHILQQHIILRVSWVFGAWGKNFVRTMLHLGRERGELNVVADQYGGPTSQKFGT